MRTNDAYYLTYLKDELRRRQAQNSSYSLRAFARDLEVDSSNLSAILRCKRRLPAHRMEKFFAKLEISPKEKMLFKSSVYRDKASLKDIDIKSSQEKQYLLDEAYFRVIAEWEYYAFLNLINLPDFIFDKNEICKRLDITQSRLETVLNHLIELGFIEYKDENTLVRLAPKLETSEDIESVALQKSHQENLNLAAKKLKEINIEARDYSSITFNFDLNQMNDVKGLIRDFQDRLAAFADGAKGKSEVYQLNCQLFPLTNINSQEKEHEY